MLTSPDPASKLISRLEAAGRPLSSSELLLESPDDEQVLAPLLSQRRIMRKDVPGVAGLVVYWLPDHTKEPPPDTARVALQSDISRLRAKLADLESEARVLEGSLSPGTNVDAEASAHIKRLHDYNEIKDIGQLLFGRLAEREGTTTRSMYERFDLGVDD
ncbi:Swi5-domain-containing protein [Powellomyces hirtus]|nr:Swi5-domain-containing protein [Powellomyces hirtus]